MRSYLHGRDGAHWATTFLLKGRPGNSYNLGSDQPITLHELAKITARCLAPHLPIEIVSPLRDACLPTVYVPCIDKAAMLGLGVTIPLEKAIQSTARRAAHFFAHADASQPPGPNA